MKFCKYCGKEIKENNKFCDNCGVKVENDTIEEDDPIDNIKIAVENASKNEKMSGYMIAVIAILSLIIISLIIIIAIRLTKNEKVKDNTNNNSPSVVEKDTIDDIEDDTDAKVESNTYEFSGYKFIVPKGYTPSIDDKYLVLTNMEDKIQIAASVLSYQSYSKISSNLETLKQELIEEGATVSTIKEEQIDNTSAVIIVATKNTTHLTYVITALNEYDTLVTAYMNKGSKRDSEIKSVAIALAKEATKETSSFSETKNTDYKKGQIKIPKFTLKK